MPASPGGGSTREAKGKGSISGDNSGSDNVTIRVVPASFGGAGETRTKTRKKKSEEKCKRKEKFNVLTEERKNVGLMEEADTFLGVRKRTDKMSSGV